MRAPGSYVRPLSRSTPKTPSHAENVTPSSVRNDRKVSMKLVATIISAPPRSRLIVALTPTAQARGIANPRVCAVKPAEYIDIALISAMPTTAVRR